MLFSNLSSVVMFLAGDKNGKRMNLRRWVSEMLSYYLHFPYHLSFPFYLLPRVSHIPDYHFLSLGAIYEVCDMMIAVDLWLNCV
jgi:hypothetical protein